MSQLRIPSLIGIAAATFIVAVSWVSGASWIASAATDATDQRTVAISAGFTGFDPDEITADPGEELVIQFTNVDLTSHGLTFELDGGRTEGIEPIGTGRTENISFTAPAVDGAYPYYSQKGDDRANGFEGVLLVGDATQQARTIEVEGFNYGYTPELIAARPGEEITIELTSTDGFHDIVFELEDGRVEQTDRVSTGETTSVTFTVPDEPGEYVFYCSVGNHREQGMEGLLVVGEPMRIEGSNYQFDPDTLSAQPGEILLIEFASTEGFHDLVFEYGDEPRTPRVSTGESTLIAVRAPETSGEYFYYCSVGNHRQNGMEGVLTVAGEAATSTPTPGGTTATPTMEPATVTPTPETETPPPTSEYDVLLDGLDSPHGLYVGSGGSLLISEGGTGDPMPGGFAPGNGDGRVIRYDHSSQDVTVLIDEMTNAQDPGGGIVGANHAIRIGDEVLVAQSGGPGHLRPDEAARILRVTADGAIEEVVDTLDFEEANNPGGETGPEGIDSNPWRLVPGAPGSGTVFVVDAGANAIFALDMDSETLSTWAVFEPLTEDGAQQAIPTGLVFDDQGVGYATLLGQFGPPMSASGAGQLRRLEDVNGDGDVLDEGENTVHLDGMWTPTDVVISEAGGLYVAEIVPGRIVYVPTGGVVTSQVVVDRMPAISAMAFLPDGDLLVTQTSDPAEPPAPSLRPDRILRIPASDLEPGVEPTPRPSEEPTEAPTAGPIVDWMLYIPVASAG